MHTAGGSHHLHTRKRIHLFSESFPHPDKLKRFLDRAMIVVALGGPIVLVPQVYQILALKDASAFSPITWVMWEISSACWLTYGIVHKEMPIIIGNSCYLILQAIIIWAIFVY